MADAPQLLLRTPRLRPPVSARGIAGELLQPSARRQDGQRGGALARAAGGRRGRGDPGRLPATALPFPGALRHGRQHRREQTGHGPHDRLRGHAADRTGRGGDRRLRAALGGGLEAAREAVGARPRTPGRQLPVRGRFHGERKGGNPADHRGTDQRPLSRQHLDGLHVLRAVGGSGGGRGERHDQLVQPGPGRRQLYAPVRRPRTAPARIF
mmetsp:Transcript_25300/g.50381  ORF Transcript_25300/g.50381 Transcript_25300/m.50381 type:complete len:211 (+) Transcript_25300:1023-1655(+)